MLQLKISNFHPILFEGIRAPVYVNDAYDLATNNGSIENGFIVPERTGNCLVFVLDKKGKVVDTVNYLVTHRPLPNIRLHNLRGHSLGSQVYSKIVSSVVELPTINGIQSMNVSTEIIQFDFIAYRCDDIVYSIHSEHPMLNIGYFKELKEIEYDHVYLENIEIEYQDGYRYVMEKVLVPETQLMIE